MASGSSTRQQLATPVTELSRLFGSGGGGGGQQRVQLGQSSWRGGTRSSPYQRRSASAGGGGGRHATFNMMSCLSRKHFLLSLLWWKSSSSNKQIGREEDLYSPEWLIQGFRWYGQRELPSSFRCWRVWAPQVWAKFKDSVITLAVSWSWLHLKLFEACHWTGKMLHQTIAGFIILWRRIIIFSCKCWIKKLRLLLLHILLLDYG